MGKLKGYKMREIQRKNKEASTADVKANVRMNIDRNEWNFWWKSKKKKPRHDKD